MKKTPEIHNDKTQTDHYMEESSVSEQNNGQEDLSTDRKTDTQKAAEQQVGYPDISKANTKTVVLISLFFILVIFFLSIFVSDKSNHQSTTEQTEEIPSTTEQSETEHTEESSTELFDMGDTEKPAVVEALSVHILEKPEPGFSNINGNRYYLTDNSSRFTGWLMADDICYCFREDGTMVTGWYQTEGNQYYFNEDGIMQTNQWIDGKYVGEDGSVLTNTVTPDGNYVGMDGTRNNSVSLETSKEGLTDLKKNLETKLDGYSGSWSIYVKNIEKNEYLVINNIQYYSASIIKLYCAATIYDLIDNGTLEETERIDSLLAQMISVSDNDAFNLLVMQCDEHNNHVAGRGVIQDYIDRNGYHDTTITSMLVPTKYKAPSSPGRNYATAVDSGLLLEKIYKGKCVSPEASADFLNLLLNQTHLNKIPGGLPEGTTCANKTGDTNEFQHDAAIVYSPGCDYIICIMSQNCGAAITNMQNLSKTVYEYFN